jgi:hypothetical protein
MDGMAEVLAGRIAGWLKKWEQPKVGRVISEKCQKWEKGVLRILPGKPPQKETVFFLPLSRRSFVQFLPPHPSLGHKGHRVISIPVILISDSCQVHKNGKRDTVTQLNLVK